MNPFSPAFVPGFAHQQSQSLMVAPLHSNTAAYPAPKGTKPFGTYSDSIAAHGANLVLPMPKLDRYSRDIVTHEQRIAMNHLPKVPRQVEIDSPILHRDSQALLHKLNNLDIQDPSDNSNARVTYGLDADKIATPSEMPIGNLVHLKEPPTWGVVKISNIPYSITKQEIFQFLGRQARLITPDNGCPIHIIMERSTAKTMDCYVEFQSQTDAKDTVIRINRIYETGRAPRLGNRHVEVELTDQNELLKDLFPRAKCIVWRGGMPYLMPNDDPYCSGFTGFFTREEIILAIRHAEIPHRSPFQEKCPQRSYESTISTLYKYPWYAPELYTVHDRNQLFELANRHIMSLVSRVKRVNTVGLDQKLLHDLLQAGLRCPAFNERQKYTLCINSEITSEINKFPEIGKWFPFDSLARMPNFSEELHLYYASLITNGTMPNIENIELSNMFPMEHPTLRSPYGSIWFEWPQSVSSSITWESAVNHEMFILSSLVFTGWIKSDMNTMLNLRKVSNDSSFSLAVDTRRKIPVSPYETDGSQSHSELSSPPDTYKTPSRRASESASMGGALNPNNSGRLWNHKLLLYSGKGYPAYRGHRITQSSPMCLPSPTTNPWGEERED
ncbi:hypothetical protein BJY01DRAFT_256788 [Aspergillus pseudoustus]|uniref:RRM domain-containing protein n=1 Tax=Aspergillus pseudoustus TaxID=1810923 RepID=A0ABR4JTB6_9EURO